MSEISRATEILNQSLGKLSTVGVNIHHGGHSWLAWGRPGDDELRLADADGLVVVHNVRTWTFDRREITRGNDLIVPDRTTRLVELDRHGFTRAWRLAFPGTAHAWQWWDTGRSAVSWFCTGVSNG